MEKELIIKRKGLEGYYTLFRGATAVCIEDGRKTRIIVKETYRQKYFGLKGKKVSREIIKDSEDPGRFKMYDRLILEGVR